jgi:hypothetical protein
MRLLSRRRRNGLALTELAVSAHLAGAGFPPGGVGEDCAVAVEGFEAMAMGAPHVGRVAVVWHAFADAYDDPRETEASFLVSMATLLEQADYQVEMVDGEASSHLVVWTEGEF